jgi:hypothetical protein
MHQRGRYSMLVGRVVVGTSVKGEVGVGRFTVHSMAQRTIRSPVDIYVKEGEVAFKFGLHGERNGLLPARPLSTLPLPSPHY